MKTDFTFFKKATAVFLSALFFCLACASLIGIAYAAEHDFYSSTASQVYHDTLDRCLAEEAYALVGKYFTSEQEDLVSYYKDTDFRFTLTDETGSILLSNYTEEAIVESARVRRLVNFTTIDPDTKEEMTVPTAFIVTAYTVEEGVPLFGGLVNFSNVLFSVRFVLIGLVAVFLIGLIGTFVYLLLVAGRHHKGEKAICGPIEKCPFDVYLLIYVIIGCLFLFLLDGLQYSIHDIVFFLITSLVAIAAYLLILGFSMSVSIRLKTKTILKNTVIYMVFSVLFRLGRSFFRNLPLIWKAIIIAGVWILSELIGLTLLLEIYLPYTIFRALLMMGLFFYAVWCFRKLQKGAETIKNGDYSKEIDTAYMVDDFRSFGETLNTVNDGLSTAVDAKMRSERLKTELITNVSHDIKTPLTSIISYADLLKKENIENDTAKGYIEVIDRQATRLKKLITDLVEASKASTGNIQVNLETVDAAVLLEQVAGEYDEKLRFAELIPALRIPEEPIYIRADGRLIFRVFDNLMSNICKYSLPGTRVYLNAATYDGMCIISFKNISKTELNISPEELLERFVRADSSRSTEGNGLGLSIVQSLVELQGGTLDLTSDGDLFKVNLSFPTVEKKD